MKTNHFTPGAIVLSAFFIGSMVTSTLVASKLTLFYGFTFSVGLLFFPVTFIVSEIGAEIYGAKFSKTLVLSGIAVQVAMLLALLAGDALPGSPIRDVSASYHEMFALAPRMTFASIVAYVCSQFIDIESFLKIKVATRGRMLWLRSVIAIMISQAVDTLIFTALFLGGVIPLGALLNSFLISYAVKVLVGVLDTPLLYLGVYWVKKLDEVEKSQSLSATGIQTEIFRADQNLVHFIVKSVPQTLVQEGMVLAITSKIVSLAEGAFGSLSEGSKRDWVNREADLFIDETARGVALTVKHGILIPSAGIDESNSESGQLILFPKDPYLSAEKLRSELAKVWRLTNLGIIITDSHITPLRRGVTGIALSHAGFLATRDYTGKKDLFGRTIRMTEVNVTDALATAAVFKMGEVSERCPLAVVFDDTVQFTENVPLEKVRAQISIPLDEDLFAIWLKPKN